MASDHDSGGETSPPPPASEGRKSTKPIMEKRRRARINASLTELKSLLLEVMKKEGTRHNKMEKADILEMTVKHLRQIQRHQFAAAMATDPSMINKYHAGFNECANEVSRYLGSIEGLDVDVSARLLNHLANTITGLNSNNPSPTPTPTPATAHVRPIQAQAQVQAPSSPASQTPVSIAPKTSIAEVNNNTVSGVQTVMSGSSQPTKVIGGVQLLPSKLPGGDVAFVIPGNVLTGGHFPSYIIPLYTGAPVAASAPPVSQGQTPTPAVISPSLAPLSSSGTLGQLSLPGATLSTPLMVLPTPMPTCGAVSSPPPPSPTPPPVAPSNQMNNDRNNNIEGHPNHNDQVVKDEDVWRPW